MQQIDNISLVGPVGIDAFHRCRLVVIPKNPAVQPILLGECRPRDMSREGYGWTGDVIKLSTMWDSTLVLTPITEGNVCVIVDLLRVHPASDWSYKLLLRVQGRRNTPLETTYYSSGMPLGPFRVIGRPDPDIYNLWYKDGLPSLQLYKKWTKQDDFFDNGDLFTEH